ncbi:MAG: TMEM165/GDT1 family protein [Clostridiaceae bacterium]|jgi:putative Ca2+/H+ antiporter (TMEM165/GDT1 family)|nr:TMEM165/GDT1 family protein [Bacillota bacterium]NLI38552.1 TMEM165/GDT1 family protein [Clostridiaceae bacterium]
MNFDIGVMITTFGMVLLMEMGDKTQLLVMACASKYKARHVFAGILISIIVLNLLAVLLGSALGGIKVIQDIVKAAASLLFIVFGLLSLRKEEEEATCSTGTSTGAIITVALAFFLAEIGDKTQLSTFSFSALYPDSPASVFIGSTVALLIADCIGLAAGAVALKYIPARIMTLISSFLFIIFGLASEWSALRNNFGMDESQAMIIVGVTATVALLIAALMLIFQKKQVKNSCHTTE